MNNTVTVIIISRFPTDRDKTLESITEAGQFQIITIDLWSESKSRGELIKDAVSQAKGETVFFMHGGDTIGTEVITAGKYCMSKYKEHTDCIIAPQIRTGKANNQKLKSIRPEIIPSSQYIHMQLRGIFLPASLLRHCKINQALNIWDDVKLISEAVSKKGNFCILPDLAVYRYTVSEIAPSIKPKEWFFEGLSLVEHLLENKASSPYAYKSAVKIIIDLMQEKSTKGLFTTHEKNNIWQRLTKVLESIDDSYISNSSGDLMLQELINKIKYSKEEISTNALNIFRKIPVSVTVTEVSSNSLRISGYFSSVYPAEQTGIIAGNQSYIPCRYVRFDRYILGNLAIPSYYFDMFIPLKEAEENIIEFFIKYKTETIPLSMIHTYKSPLAYYSNMYYCDGSWLVKMTGKNKIMAVKYSYEKACKWEEELIKEMSIRSKNFAEEIKELRRKILLSLSHPNRPRVWLFTDSPNRADDNGEHLFRYAVKQNDGINKYFILAENSPDYKRIEETGEVIPYGSSKHIELLCLCEKLISSHIQYLREECNMFKFYRGFMTTPQSYLRHGIGHTNNNNLPDNILCNFEFFASSSQYEYDDLVKNGIRIKPPILRLTGMPRYDSLHDAAENIILAAFTWRMHLVNPPNQFGMREYNPEFKHSGYFKAINSFLNNRNLVNALREYGYIIYFKSHPYIYSQIGDFDRNEMCRIIETSCSYQELYAKSKLMITDYSSAFFDFSYLRKPVLYYQFEPNHYEDSYYSWESMGFGEVAVTEGDIIKLILDYIKEGCIIKEKYVSRIDDFFKYRDRENCSRVYKSLGMDKGGKPYA